VSINKSLTQDSIGDEAVGFPPQDVTSVHRSHADFVWRSLQRLGVRPADLEDALQDTFVVVNRKLHTFDGSSRMSTWLFGVCIRVAAAYRRRAHRRREQSVETPDLGTDPSSDPESAAIERQNRERLERVLERLDLDKRAVFVMFEIDGLSAVEIAEMLGVPVGTVYSRLSAARAAFKKAALRLAQRTKGGQR
jgi:RNA polymerase sigma-70 factor, ECF subfamily